MEIALINLNIAGCTAFYSKEEILNISVAVLWSDMVKQGPTSCLIQSVHGNICLLYPVLKEVEALVFELVVSQLGRVQHERDIVL